VSEHVDTEKNSLAAGDTDHVTCCPDEVQKQEDGADGHVDPNRWQPPNSSRRWGIGRACQLHLLRRDHGGGEKLGEIEVSV